MGYLDRIKYVEIESCKRIKILKNNNQPLHIDGEIADDCNEVEAIINPASLWIIVPQ